MPNRKAQEAPKLEHPAPQWPRTFLHRLASLIPFTHRTAAPPSRPNTAPAASNSALPPRLDIPTFYDYHIDPCPHDPDVYYSFPSIERWRPGSILFDPFRFLTSRKSTAGSNASRRTCSAGRADCPCTHIARTVPSSQPRRTSLAPANKTGSSAFAGPKRPDIERGKGKRVSFHGLPPLNSVNPHFAGPSSSPSRPPTRHGPPENGEPSAFDRLRDSLSSLDNERHTPSPTSPRPTSPRLHHFHGLPHSHDYPYIRRHDARRYLAQLAAEQVTAEQAAARAEYLTLQTRRPYTTSDAPGHGYSSMTVYKRGVPHISITRDTYTRPEWHCTAAGPSRPLPVPVQSQAQARTRTQNAVSHRSSNHLRAGSPVGHISNLPLATTLTEPIQASRGMNIDSPSRPTSAASESETTDTLKITPRESTSGDQPHHQHPEPASQEEQRTDSSSSATETSLSALPPETPSTIGGLRMELRGGASDPGSGFDDYACYAESREDSHAWNISDSAYYSSDGERTSANSSGSYPPLTIWNPCREACQGSTNVSLRGGNGSSEDGPHHPQKLQNGDRLPCSLWWSADGTGRAPSVRAWKRQRIERRMGGLFGMAVLGERAGMSYGRLERRRRRGCGSKLRAQKEDAIEQSSGAGETMTGGDEERAMDRNGDAEPRE